MVRSGTPPRGDIRAAGGSVEPAPEFNERVGQTNYQHVDVCLGEGACQWSDLTPNVPKNLRFGGKDYPFYLGSAANRLTSPRSLVMVQVRAVRGTLNGEKA